MKVIVTGATGFIGRKLIETLLSKGVEITALVRSESTELPKSVKQIIGDITKPETLQEAGKDCGRLYHLAAMITFDHAKLPELQFVNGQGTVNILKAAKRWHVERTVVVSSACAMGITYDPGKVLDEDSVPAAGVIKANPYLESKLACEQAAVDASREACVVIVNPTSVYGPGDKTLNSGTLIKTVLTSKVVPVPSGGTSVIDVEDVVEGIIAAGEKGISGRRYILTEENIRFADIIGEITRLCKRKPFLVNIPAFLRKPAALGAAAARSIIKSRFITPQIIGDLFAYKYYSNSRAKEELGWVPKYSFSQSMERALKYYRQEGLL